MSGDPKAALEALAVTPTWLTNLSRGADHRSLTARPAPDEWSATEIVAHLRANADTWGASIRRMIDEDHPTLRYVSPRSVMKKPEYSERAFRDGLDLFLARRKELLETLNALPARAWSRGATFKGLAKSEQTVLSYAQRIAAHEEAHRPQFEALFRKPPV